MLNGDYWYDSNNPQILEQAYLTYMQASVTWGSSGSPLFLLPKSSSLEASRPILLGVNKGYVLNQAPVQWLNDARSKTSQGDAYVSMPDELVITEPVGNVRDLIFEIEKTLKVPE